MGWFILTLHTIKQRLVNVRPESMLYLDPGGSSRQLIMQLSSLISIESNLKFKTEEKIVKSTFARVVLCLAVLAFSLTALAASKNGVVLTKNGRQAIATNPSAKKVPFNPAADAGLTTIYSNISKYPYAKYFCCYGWTLSGPSSGIGEQIWLAAPFTPSSNATATKVETSAGTFGGTNELVISIFSDSGGLPGTALASKHVKNLSEFGDCCVLTTAKFPAGVALTGGTQYWVVMSTDNTDADFEGAWAINTTDDRETYTFAVNTGSGWGTTESFLGGYAVLGH